YRPTHRMGCELYLRGTVTVIEFAAHAVGWAVVPLRVTLPVPCVAPKFAPLMVTDVPTGPAATDRLVMAGPVGGGALTTRVNERLWPAHPLFPVTVSV